MTHRLPAVSPKTVQEILQIFRDAHHLRNKPELLTRWLHTMTEQNPDMAFNLAQLAKIPYGEDGFLWGAAFAYAMLNGQLAADNAL